MRDGTRVGPYRVVKRLWYDGPAGGFLGKHEESGREVIIRPLPTWALLSRRSDEIFALQKRFDDPPWLLLYLEILPASAVEGGRTLATMSASFHKAAAVTTFAPAASYAESSNPASVPAPFSIRHS